MQELRIPCAFCKGTGHHPHYRATCPVCKGAGANQVSAANDYMTCGDCHGSGRKSGTTLTCYTCIGLGIVPDIRKDLQAAREAIRKVRVEIEKAAMEERAR